MIYLFDEAKERQKGYLWDSKKFAEYASYIKPIYNFDEYRSIKREVFATGNTSRIQVINATLLRIFMKLVSFAKVA